MKFFFVLFLALCSLINAESQFPLDSYQTLIDSMVPGSRLGLSIRSLQTGEELGAIRGEEKFTPASTLKTLTTAAALHHLPLHYEPKTHFFLDGSIQNGIFKGVLRVRGEGDPNISARFYPDPLYLLHALADSLKTLGIHSMVGKIELDTSFYSGPRKPLYWAPHFYNAWYGAEVSPIQFNDNCTLIRMKPGEKQGDTAIISIHPDVGYVQVKNELVTGKKKRRRWTWALNDTLPIITIGGNIGEKIDSAHLVLPVRNPPLYFKHALLTALNNKGISFEENKNQSRGIEIKSYSISGAPLLSILDEINQRSQNLHAETLLRNMGKIVVNQGSVEGGKKAIHQYLTKIGLPAEDFEFVDGSGLSQKNKVKPSSETKLLRHTAHSAYSDIYIRSLASPDVGTGSKRMKNIQFPWRTRFKTGFIGGVHALAGYIFTTNDTLAVALYLNETGKNSDATSKDALDSIWLRLIQVADAEYQHIIQAKEFWLSAMEIKDVQKRIQHFSEQLLETPYSLGPTGEGFKGKIDSKPIFRLDSVDCVTYMENVLALSFAPHEDSIFSTLKQIRYLQGKPSFVNRKHYFIADWIQKSDFAKMVISEEDTTVEKNLPKKKFFEAKGIKHQNDELLKLSYLPLNKAKEFAGKNWNGVSEIRGVGFVFAGDVVDVFHVGFLLLNPGEKPIFRHASQISGKVITQTLESYLENSKKKIPGIVQFEFLGN